MEAVNHWMLPRAEPKAYLRETGIETSVSVPDYGLLKSTADALAAGISDQPSSPLHVSHT